VSLAFRPPEAAQDDRFLVFSILLPIGRRGNRQAELSGPRSHHPGGRSAIYVGILAVVVMSTAIVLVVHFARTVVLSGYIMYPSTLGPFPVDWRIPEPFVRHAHNVLWAGFVAPGCPGSRFWGTGTGLVRGRRRPSATNGKSRRQGRSRSSAQ
jgi:hypothetical protein